MAKKTQNSTRRSRKSRQKDRPGWSKLLLTLTLVPMVMGVLLILAWALEFDLWGAPEDQIVVGFLFILFSFAASNAIQRNWRLSGGWALLAVADLLVLSWLEIWIQVLSMLAGAAGLALIVLEFVQRYRDQQKARKRA